MTYLLTHYTESWQPLIDIVKPIHQQYCDKHGYKYILKKVSDYSVYTGIEKLEMILENVGENDFAFVLDADAVITNYSFKITDFLLFGSTMVFSEGLNMGVFITSGDSDDKLFFRFLILLIEKKICNCEQDALELLYKYKLISDYDHIKISLHPCFNSYMSELYPEIKQPVTEKEGQWIEGKSFVLHLPGISMSERIRIINKIKEKIVYE